MPESKSFARGLCGSNPWILALSVSDTKGMARHGTGSTPVYVVSWVEFSPAPAYSDRSLHGNKVLATGMLKSATSLLLLAKLTFRPILGVWANTIHTS